jgi:hypothetical protein
MDTLAEFERGFVVESDAGRNPGGESVAVGLG